jgi:hypothetical protein
MVELIKEYKRNMSHDVLPSIRNPQNVGRHKKDFTKFMATALLK